MGLNLRKPLPDPLVEVDVLFVKLMLPSYRALPSSDTNSSMIHTGEDVRELDGGGTSAQLAADANVIQTNEMCLAFSKSSSSGADLYANKSVIDCDSYIQSD